MSTECIPEASKYQHVPYTEEIINQLHQTLSRDPKSPKSKTDYKLAAESVAGRAMLKTLALNAGDRVMIDKCRGATLRYKTDRCSYSLLSSAAASYSIRSFFTAMLRKRAKIMIVGSADPWIEAD